MSFVKEKCCAGIHVHASPSVVRVFSISKGGVDGEDEVRLRAQPLWNGNSIISSIWAILTRHINLGESCFRNVMESPFDPV